MFWAGVLGLILWGAPGAAIAAPATMTTTSLSALQEQVEATLQAIPQGFYGILQTEQLKTLLANETPLLVDVREPAEYQVGHIPGALNLPLRELTQHLEQIPHDRPVVLYCSTGYRTGIGVMALHLLGYDNVRGYPPSYQGWKRDTAA
jgi:rhodanese-related sulfurtransferase